MAQQVASGFDKLPKEILAQIFELCVDNQRLVGIHPSRDLRAAVAPLPAVAQVNRKCRDAFGIICARIVDDADYRAGPAAEKVPGNRHDAVYVSPELDTLAVGFETVRDGALLAAPAVPMLVAKLKSVWLHDRDMVASLGHGEFHEDSLSADIRHAAELPLADVVYPKLSSITITAERHDALLRDNEDDDDDDDETLFGFKAIYHVETGLVFMTRLESFDDADWLNKRLANPAFPDSKGFMLQIAIDRTRGIRHIAHATVDAVITDGMKEDQQQHSDDSDQGDDSDLGEYDYDDDDDDDDEEDEDEEDMTDLEYLEHFDVAPNFWRYNWYLAVDYITQRLAK